MRKFKTQKDKNRIVRETTGAGLAALAPEKGKVEHVGDMSVD